MHLLNVTTKQATISIHLRQLSRVSVGNAGTPCATTLGRHLPLHVPFQLALAPSKDIVALSTYLLLRQYIART